MTSVNRRAAVVNEMGLGPVWKLRGRAEENTASSEQHEPVQDGVPMPQEPVEAAPMEEVFSADAPPAFFDEIPWEEGVAAEEPASLPNVANMDWDELEPTILQCTACRLCENRTQVVPGAGDRKASWLFIGEGPGFHEDQQGKPFVGPSGKLLDNMLRAMHLKREDVYIANIVKCRPTGEDGRDRPPSFEEARACRPYLERQITLIQPDIIVSLGRTSATMLLETEAQTSLASLRGRVHTFRTSDGTEVPLIATYHPAYLLRQLGDKRKAWGDLCMAMNAKPASSED